MSNLEIIEEEPLTMVDVKEELIKIEKREKELTVRASKANEYLTKFVKIDKKTSDDLKEKLHKLEILRLKDKHITKIIDVQPEDIDSLKALFAGDNLTFKQEELEKVLLCIK
jgi:DNA-directed RNA polymerase subunit F